MASRLQIRDAFIERIKTDLDGSKSDQFFTNLEGLVGKFKKFEDIREFPYVAVHAGLDSSDYEPSAMKWKYLDMSMFIYVNSSDDDKRETELNNLIYDLEKIIDSPIKIRYNINRPDGSTLTGTVVECDIQNNSTDEGLLAPYGFAEIPFRVKYRLDSRSL